MTKKWICSVVLSGVVFSVTLGVDIDNSIWRGGGTSAKVSVTAEPNAMGDVAGFKLTAEPAPKKETFACATYTFPAPVDFTNFKSIEFSVKTDHTVSIKVRVNCEGGYISVPWNSETVGNEFKKFTFGCADMKTTDKPDLGKVTGIYVDFGTWHFDTDKEGFNVIVAGFKITDTTDTPKN